MATEDPDKKKKEDERARTLSMQEKYQHALEYARRQANAARLQDYTHRNANI